MSDYTVVVDVELVVLSMKNRVLTAASEPGDGHMFTEQMCWPPFVFSERL